MKISPKIVGFWISVFWGRDGHPCQRPRAFSALGWFVLRSLEVVSCLLFFFLFVCFFVYFFLEICCENWIHKRQLYGKSAFDVL